MTKTSAYNVAVGMIVALGSFSYGFGFATFATSIGQPGFYAYFKLDPESSYTNSILGAVNALFFFGACVGALGAGPLADHIGRRLTILAAALIALVGGALAAGSVAIAMLIVVRILQGCGLGALATLTPVVSIFALRDRFTPSLLWQLMKWLSTSPSLRRRRSAAC